MAFGIHYELSDDWFFAKNIAEGHYDFTFCSYFIQLLTGLLQKVIYPVNAFLLLQIIFCYISFTTVSFVFMEHLGTKRGFFVSVLIGAFFSFNGICMTTFTKTAAILCVAGLVIMTWSYCEGRSKLNMVYGFFLLLFGSFYRFKIIYSAFAMFAVFMGARVLACAELRNLRATFQTIKGVRPVRIVLMIALIFGTLYSVNCASKAIIYSGEGMEYYREYNSLRSSIVDFDMPSYSDPEVAQKLQAVGVSENDYKMLRKWYMDDQGVGNIETLKAVCAVQAAEGRSPQQAIKDMLRQSWKNVTNFTAEGCLIWICVLLAVGYFLLRGGKSWIYVTALFLGVAVLYSYLWIEGRSNYRAVFSIWISESVFLGYSVKFTESRRWVQKLLQKSDGSRELAVAICAALIVCITNNTAGKIVSALSLEEEYDASAVEEYILSADEDTKFVLCRNAYLSFRNSTQLYNPLILEMNEAFSRCLYYSTPYYAHPSYNRMLDDIGLENLYTDIIDNPNAFLIDYEDIKMFVEYLNEQYGNGKTYGYENVTTVGFFGFYRIFTVE